MPGRRLTTEADPVAASRPVACPIGALFGHGWRDALHPVHRDEIAGILKMAVAEEEPSAKLRFGFDRRQRKAGAGGRLCA